VSIDFLPGFELGIPNEGKKRYRFDNMGVGR
jgi:hypothetical protein